VLIPLRTTALVAGDNPMPGMITAPSCKGIYTVQIVLQQGPNVPPDTAAKSNVRRELRLNYAAANARLFFSALSHSFCLACQ
jgi:hypothetical protein